MIFSDLMYSLYNIAMYVIMLFKLQTSWQNFSRAGEHFGWTSPPFLNIINKFDNYICIKLYLKLFTYSSCKFI